MATVTERAETGSGNASSAGCDPRVFVLDANGRPLMPCHPAWARELLSKKRAVVVRRVPFVIRLKDRVRADSVVQGVQVRIDPGSRCTGIAVTDEKPEGGQSREVSTVRRGLVAFELQHRGNQIRDRLERRSRYRRRRRGARLRYRARRFDNRVRPKGWLAPSLRHRVDTTVAQAERLVRWAPVTEIHVERVAFDVHALSVGRDLSGVEYQRGTLLGTEVREYLLAKWRRSCAYCGATGVPLNIDHIVPKARGGSDRVSNLVLACVPCNQDKAARPVEEFLARRPERLRKIRTQVKAPLRDAAVMNAVRWRLADALDGVGLPVRHSSGGRTKWNRTAMGLAKSHTLDALAIGDLFHEEGDMIVRHPARVTVISATGRGSYARTRTDRHGFPRLRLTRTKVHHGYQTGDLVRATVPRGKRAGTYTGRVAVRASGSFNITTAVGTVQGIHHSHFRMLQRADGYAYTTKREEGASRSEPKARARASDHP
ncbi:RNA-guided endonuclease IscB [Streptomyces sp. DT2A-34]|uniref:RNA-guided endonuclease IscB n=1 Tax=Streptomyces sp. DT2A-34 TaxID=3051182 RepID=UPI00265BF33C|nr:RNA-guided endonuclease IscB [Streptomyces sp. DT2A-34]MDO0912153.1 RNA-guided endonuclease IscB [Streptomyces sp. DT2A-34]